MTKQPDYFEFMKAVTRIVVEGIEVGQRKKDYEILDSANLTTIARHDPADEAGKVEDDVASNG